MFILLVTSASGLSVMAVCLSTCRPPPPPQQAAIIAVPEEGGGRLDGACCVYTSTDSPSLKIPVYFQIVVILNTICECKKNYFMHKYVPQAVCIFQNE